MLRVDLVHAGEVGQVLQEDGGLHEVRERRARSLEDRPQVREHLLGLLRDVARDELLLARAERQLARDEHEPVRLDRLRVRCALERRGCRFGANDFLAHAISSFCRDGLAECGADRLEDRREDVLRVAPSTSRTCRFRPARLGERLQKARRDVGRDARRLAVGEVDVVTKRGSSASSRAAAASASSAGTIAQPRPAPRLRSARANAPRAPPGGDDRLVGAVGRHLERDLEPAGARELADQVVEHGQAGRDVHAALGCERDAHAAGVLGIAAERTVR